jgi:hypothetical protein
MKGSLNRLYPTLMRLLDGSRIAADLDKVRECFRAVDPVECVHEKRVQGEFGSGLLTYHLCAALGAGRMVQSPRSADRGRPSQARR